MTRWPTRRLEDVASIERRVVAPNEIRLGTKYVGLEHITGAGSIVNVREVHRGELASTKFVFTAEHVLYGKLRPYLRKVACPTFDGICSTEILPIRPGPELDQRYLFHYLRRPEVVSRATSMSVGANLPRIHPSALAAFEVPIPPRREQERIAALLDSARRVADRREHALSLVSELPIALFAEMFGDPDGNERGWPIMSVREYVARFQAGRSIRPADSDAATTRRILKVGAVAGMTFRPTESKPIPDEYVPPQEHFVRDGDVLFSRANTTELVGSVALVRKPPPNLLLPDKIWRFVWREPRVVEPMFVWILFQMPGIRRMLGQRATGTSASMQNISQATVLALDTIVPPLQLQEGFSAAVRRALMYHDHLRSSSMGAAELHASLEETLFGSTRTHSARVA